MKTLPLWLWLTNGRNIIKTYPSHEAFNSLWNKSQHFVFKQLFHKWHHKWHRQQLWELVWWTLTFLWQLCCTFIFCLSDIYLIAHHCILMYIHKRWKPCKHKSQIPVLKRFSWFHGLYISYLITNHNISTITHMMTDKYSQETELLPWQPI